MIIFLYKCRCWWSLLNSDNPTLYHRILFYRSWPNSFFSTLTIIYLKSDSKGKIFKSAIFLTRPLYELWLNFCLKASIWIMFSLYFIKKLNLVEWMWKWIKCEDLKFSNSLKNKKITVFNVKYKFVPVNRM